MHEVLWKHPQGSPPPESTPFYFQIKKEAEQKLPRHLIVAAQYLGEREIPGLKHNWKIVAMWEALKAKFRDDETPWCSAFAAHVLAQTYPDSCKKEMADTPVTAAAKSWRLFGYTVGGTEISIGDVAVFWRGNPNGASGSCRFCRWKELNRGFMRSRRQSR